MAWETALSSAIEVAIGIAGFSGIIAVFGERADRKWGVDDVLRLQMLLTASAVAGLFAFLPFILVSVPLDEMLVWKLGSGLQILWYAIISVFRYRQASLAGASMAVGLTRVMAPLFVVTVILQAANVVALASAWVYVTGVLFQLVVGFAAFVALILSKVTGENGNEST